MSLAGQWCRFMLIHTDVYEILGIWIRCFWRYWTMALWFIFRWYKWFPRISVIVCYTWWCLRESDSGEVDCCCGALTYNLEVYVCGGDDTLLWNWSWWSTALDYSVTLGYMMDFYTYWLWYVFWCTIALLVIYMHFYGFIHGQVMHKSTLRNLQCAVWMYSINFLFCIVYLLHFYKSTKKMLNI